MNSIQFWIFEDDPSIQLSLEKLLLRLGYDHFLTFSSAEEGLSQLEEKNAPDFAIIDNQLVGKKTGIEVGKVLSGYGTGLIFISSFADQQFYSRVKPLEGTLALLEKPLQEISLMSVIEQGVEKLQNRTGAAYHPLLIKDKGIYYKVNPNNINYLESDGNYTTVFLEEKKFFLKTSMRRLIEKISDVEFLQVHQKVYVNASKILQINASENKVIGANFEAPIGRTFKRYLLEKFRII